MVMDLNVMNILELLLDTAIVSLKLNVWKTEYSLIPMS